MITSRQAKSYPLARLFFRRLTLTTTYFKSDILAGLITYSTDKRIAANLVTISAERAKEVIEMNRRGEKPEDLQADGQQKKAEGPVDLLAGDSITRFDKSKKKKKKKKPQQHNTHAKEKQA